MFFIGQFLNTLWFIGIIISTLLIGLICIDLGLEFYQ